MLTGDSQKERNEKEDGVEKKKEENAMPEEQVASQINVVPDDRKYKPQFFFVELQSFKSYKSLSMTKLINHDSLFQ